MQMKAGVEEKNALAIASKAKVVAKAPAVQGHVAMTDVVKMVFVIMEVVALENYATINACQNPACVAMKVIFAHLGKNAVTVRAFLRIRSVAPAVMNATITMAVARRDAKKRTSNVATMESHLSVVVEIRQSPQIAPKIYEIFKCLKLFVLIIALLFLFYSIFRCVSGYGRLLAARAMVSDPGVFCEKECIDIGRVVSPTQKEVKFELSNGGTGDLIIEKVSPGCGACIEVADYTQTPVPPGGVGEVTLTFHSKHLHGPVSKEVLVQTNDPKQPKFILTLKAEVIRPDADDTPETP